MFPKFIGIGAQKAGTTWLHAMLSQHDEIWLPHLKELHYFDRKFPITEVRDQNPRNPAKGVITRHIAARLRRFNTRRLRERLSVRRWRDLTWEIRYLFGDWSDDWYCSLFDAAGGRLAGEITPAYSCLDGKAIAHVRALMPDVKLILLLRNPIDRAWSHAKMDLLRATRRPAQVPSVDEYLAHFNGHASRLRGDYLGMQRRWLSHFPNDQLFVGYYDEIETSPKDLLIRIFTFLGVSANDERVPATARVRINQGTDAAIPDLFHKHLAALYVESIRELALGYGTYPTQWLVKCERTLRDATATR